MFDWTHLWLFWMILLCFISICSFERDKVVFSNDYWGIIQNVWLTGFLFIHLISITIAVVATMTKFPWNISTLSSGK